MENQNNTPADNQLVDLLGQILEKNPALAEKFFKKKNSSPYYSKKFADCIRNLADTMLADKEKCAHIFEFDEYPEFKRDTLRQKLYGAIQYLVDTEPAYREWREQIEIKATDRGMIVKFKKDTRGSFNFKKISEFEATNLVEPSVWKHEVMGCATMGEGEVKSIDKLSLSEEDKQWVRNFFLGMTDFTVYIKTDRLKIIRKVFDENERIINE